MTRVIHAFDDASMFRAAVAAGAAGYVVKSAADTELLASIRTVAAGRIFVNLPGNPGLPLPESSQNLNASDQKVLEWLSTLEHAVLTLVAQGHTNQAISDRLLLSVKSVESYRFRVMGKLNLGTPAELTQLGTDIRIDAG